MLTAPAHEQLAAMLWDAERRREACASLVEIQPDITLADSYKIQGLLLQRRLREDGFHGRRPALVGWKIGLTSQAVQRWLQIDHPDFGFLLDDMQVADGGRADLGRLLQARAEGEVAFVLQADLEGPGITAAQVIAATDFVLPSIELIDSRIRDWKIKVQDTIADNGSSGLYVLGSRPTRLRDVDLRLAGMTLRKNGAVVSTGAGAACMGNPVSAVVWLANELAQHGQALRSGQIVLSGALAEVCTVSAGDHVEVEIGPLGSVSVTF